MIMNYRDEIIKMARKSISEHPHKEEEIMDIAELAIDEIEDGESPSNEYELFVSNLNEIIA